MDLWTHLRLIWRHRWRILIATVAVAGAVYAWSSSRDEVFEAEALVNVVPGRSATGENAGQEYSLFLAQSYAALVDTRPLLESAVEASGLDISADEAGDRLRAEVSGETAFIAITSSGPSARAAADLANATAAALETVVDTQQREVIETSVGPLRDEINRLADQLSGMDEEDPGRPALQSRYETLLRSVADRELRATDRVELVAAALPEGGPVAPTPIRDAVLAGLLAFIVNAELAALLARLSGRFSSTDTAEEITRVTGLPVLARVPSEPGPRQDEAFRTLRTNLIFGGVTETLRTLAVVGAEPGCGKSYTSAQLARSVASLGVRIVLVDADLRRPVQHRELGVDGTRGLTTVDDPSEVRSVAVPVPGQPDLWLLPAGPPIPDPTALLSGKVHAVLRRLDWVDLVIVDTPAAELFADASAIAPVCDATIIVVDARSTKRKTVVDMLEALNRVRANVVGVVVNRDDAQPASSYYDRYSRVEQTT